MLKPLTFSLSLAVALGTCSLGFAGGHGKSLPSAQCETPSAQCALASPQGDSCGDICGTEKKCHLLDMFKPKPKCYTYEWVLKKKRCGGGLLGGLMHGRKGCGGDACGSCGGDVVTPSAQWASPQGGGAWGSGQAGSWGTGQIGGSGQSDAAPAVEAAPAGDVPPPPPTANPGSTAGLLYLSPAGN